MTSLRTRILVIVALALTPLIALNVAGYLELRSSAIEDARSDAVAAIRSVAAAQEALLEREVGRMALIAALPEVRSAPDDVGACYDLFGLGDAGGGIGGRYLVVDAAGMGLCGTTEISAEIDYSDRAWVRTPLENGGRAAGDFVISRPTGTPLLPIGQRIEFATGEPGVLGSGIPLRSEALLPADLPVPPNSRVRLLDIEGTLLASRPEEPLGVPVDDAERLDRVLAVDAGVRQEGSTLIVVERIGPASLAGPAALVVVETSLGPALAAADRRLLRDFGVALCAVLLALALTAVLSQRQVAVPIQVLARAFERTADGIYAPLERRRGQIRELRKLHRDFDAMVSRLRDREARLVHARRDQEERARYARILNELSARSDEPLEGQVRRALRAVRTELGADLAFVSRIDAAADRFEYRLVDSDEPLAREGDVASLAETYCALVVERDDLIEVDDLACSPQRDRPGWEALPMRSFVGVPLRTADGAFGSVGFAARAPRGAPLPDAVRDFLPLFSRWIATLLERSEAAAALERSNAELEQRSRDQERLGAFGEALMAAQDLDDVVAAAADLLPALLRGPVRMVVDSHLPALEAPPVARRTLAALGPDDGGVEIRPGVRLELGAPDASENETRDDAILATVVRLLALQIAALDLRARLQRSSVRDPLTELFNRRYLFETAERELRRAERGGDPVGAIFLDVDHFKTVNDRHGHAIGDRALCAVAAILAASFRREDVVARYGGEEFVVLLPGASLADTVQRAEGLRGRIAAEGADLVRRRAADDSGGAAAALDTLQLTASVGVAAFPDHGSTVREIFDSADGACYRAKATGRDRVTVAS